MSSRMVTIKDPKAMDPRDSVVDRTKALTVAPLGNPAFAVRGP